MLNGTRTAARAVDRPAPRRPVLVGRTEERAALTALLEDAAVRLVTVTGAPGVGKSLLVATTVDGLTAAGTPAERVAAADAADTAALLDRIRDGVADGALSPDAADALWERYGGGAVVLVIDGVDSTPADAELLADLLDAYPALTVVVTGLRPLRLPDEHVFRLGPLPVPAADLSLAEAVAQPSVALFAARAAAADARFRLDETTLPAVVDVCRRLAGVPLALELAASRVAAVPPATLAATLAGRHGLDLLQDDRSGTPERHRSLRAAVAWAYDLLPPDSRTALRQLAAFERSFTWEGAAAVLDPPRDGLPAVLDDLSVLVDAHVVDLDASTDAPRFSLLPWVRAHAREQAADDGELAAAIGRHDAYVEDRCRAVQRVAAASGRPEAWDELAPDWAEVLATLDRAILGGRVHDALHLALDAAGLVAGGEAREQLHGRLEEIISGAREQGGDRDDAQLALALVWSVADEQGPRGDPAEYSAWTRQRVRDAIATARRAGDDRALLQALELSIRALPISLDLETGLAAAPEGMALAERLGDRAAVSRFMTWQGLATRYLGDGEAAERLARGARDIAQSLPDDAAVLSATVLLEMLAADRGSIDPTLPPTEETLARAQQLGDRRSASFLLEVLAQRSLAAGDTVAAAGWVGRRLALESDARLQPHMNGYPVALAVVIAVRRGDYDTAARIDAGIASVRSALEAGVAGGAFAPYAAAVAALEQALGADAAADPVPLALAAARAQEYVRGIVAAPAAAQASPAPEPAPVLGTAPAGAESAPDATGDATSGDGLTPREREVLEQLATGASNKEIAAALGMSPKTVMHHTVAIYRKLGVRGRGEATAWLFRHRPPSASA